MRPTVRVVILKSPQRSAIKIRLLTCISPLSLMGDYCTLHPLTSQMLQNSFVLTPVEIYRVIICLSTSDLGLKHGLSCSVKSWFQLNNSDPFFLCLQDEDNVISKMWDLQWMRKVNHFCVPAPGEIHLSARLSLLSLHLLVPHCLPQGRFCRAQSSGPNLPGQQRCLLFAFVNWLIFKIQTPCFL